jgi:hypothetical protein
MKKIIALSIIAAAATFASEDRAPEVQLAIAMPTRPVLARPEIRLVADSAEVQLKQVASVKPPVSLGSCYKVSEAGGCWSE